MHQYHCVSLFTNNESVRQELIAIMSSTGFDAFEEKQDCIEAWITSEKFSETWVKGLLNEFPEIACKIFTVQQKNWNEQWEQSFQPVEIDDFLTIRAAFHAPALHTKYEIVITPKMSFGTGHHATTHLMVQQMANIDFWGKSVIDFGTGTAVLAILAEKMGAASVSAIDNDEWSIANASENIAANHCFNIVLGQADALPTHPVADVLLANINLNVIIDNLPAMTIITHSGSIVLLSGLLKGDEERLLPELEKNLLLSHSITERNGWIIIKCLRQ